MRSSLGALIREGAGVGVSWWLDALGILVGATSAVAIVFVMRPAAVWFQQLGAATVVAIGVCAGVAFPLLLRVITARWLAVRLASQHAEGDSKSFRSRFAAGVLRASNVSPERCSAEDLRRAAAVASAECAAFAARTATPASFVAFLVPVVALVGGWNEARQAGPSSSWLQSMAPSMIAGIACAAVVVLLIEIYVLAMRAVPRRWVAAVSGLGAEVDGAGKTIPEDHPEPETSSASGMSLDEFRRLFESPGTSGKS